MLCMKSALDEKKREKKEAVCADIISSLYIPTRQVKELSFTSSVNCKKKDILEQIGLISQ